MNLALVSYNHPGKKLLETIHYIGSDYWLLVTDSHFSESFISSS